MTELKTKIVEFRREQNITQGELADRVGVRRETIVRLERGQYNPSLKLAYDISKVFGVPIEAVFLITLERTVTLIVTIDIDKTIALGHLAGGGGNQVDAAPHGISEEVYTVFFNGLFHGTDMPLEVVNAIGVVDATVSFKNILRA